MLENTLDVSLFNPFTGTLISLPPIDLKSLLPFYTSLGIVKAILTKDPSLYPNDYMVVAIVTSNHRICLMKANDQIWSYQNPQDEHCFGDVNLCNDTLYALAQDMVLRKIEVDENLSISFTAISSPEFFLDDFPYWEVFVVQSSKKEVLLIQKFYSIECSEEPNSKILCAKTTKFFVYKLTNDYDEDGFQRVMEVESLDGDTLFIGDNQSICLLSKNFSKCLPNCIYYTDNCYGFSIPFIYGPQDAGIFNLEDKSFRKHYVTDPTQRNLPPICSKYLGT